MTNAEGTLNQNDLQELIKQTNTLRSQAENPLTGLKLNIRKLQAARRDSEGLKTTDKE